MSRLMVSVRYICYGTSSVALRVVRFLASVRALKTFAVGNTLIISVKCSNKSPTDEMGRLGKYCFELIGKVHSLYGRPSHSQFGGITRLSSTCSAQSLSPSLLRDVDDLFYSFLPSWPLSLCCWPLTGGTT